jgi:hypothetical protein
LTPRGIRDGYAPPKLLNSVPQSQRAKLSSRAVWVSTSNPIYAVGRIRVGATQAAAERALPHGNLFHIGSNYWYLAPAGAATAVLKIRRQQVQEIGIASSELARTRMADLTLMTSFDYR